MNRKEYHKEYYLKNRDRLLTQSKLWGKENKERKILTNRLLRQADPEHYEIYNKRYREEGKEYFLNNWKDMEPLGKYISKSGYVVLRFYHGIKISEHRWIIMRKLGRFLNSWEEVHHRNGYRTDNRLSNLVLRPEHGHWLTFDRLVEENKRLKKELKKLKDRCFKNEIISIGLK